MEKRDTVVLALGGGGAWFFFMEVFMSHRLSLTSVEKAFLDDALIEAERAAGKKLSRLDKNAVLDRAREQVKAQRYADQCRAERDKERHAAEFTWTKPKPFRR